MTDMFDSFWSPHFVVCPCGASCRTGDVEVVKAFITAHKEHQERKKP